MTERAYYFSDLLEMDTEVVRCEAQEDGRFRVQLAATLFHPQGGGQPADQGTIGEARVLQLVQEEGELLHITDREVALGRVHIRIDAALRELHTRYHSAGHLIAYAGEKFGWLGYKGDHRPGNGRVVFKPQGEPQPVDESAIAEGVDALVAQDLARGLRDDAVRRMVSWGELTPYACGGTHVPRTSEVGEIVITRVKAKKGELSVQYEVRD
ncbi:alanyl-tRNA editing protein [Erwinia sp. S59]|uniref:alanyl-tRNA editing protein n=1 Tax=Erwinia sp. S59 TaxID=2769340 RepID=UPI00190A8859|nr:alanyl-tRNA editing protein [Erwinia sp. S59]MBK0091123.1 alanyl-tRNA editing protein [Erwinia sp. S59]